MGVDFGLDARYTSGRTRPSETATYQPTLSAWQQQAADPSSLVRTALATSRVQLQRIMMPNTPESNTETAEKHGLILDQAIAVFAERGFRNTDVQVIADRAGVGKGTVYRHFGNKEDLFWKCTLEVVERLDRHMQKAMVGIASPTERLRASARAYGEFFQGNPDYLEMLIQERAEFRGSVPPTHADYHEQLIQRYGAIVEEGMARGEIRPVHVRRTIIAIGGLLYGAVVHAGYVACRDPLVDAAGYAMDIFLRGIAAPSCFDEAESGSDRSATSARRSTDSDTEATNREDLP